MRLNPINRNSLSFQIGSICLIIPCIISFIVVGICYSGFTKLLLKNTLQSCSYNLSLVSSSFNTDVQKITDFLTWCQFDQDIQSYLEISQNYQADPSIKTLFNVSSVQTYEKVNSKFFSSVSNYIDRLIISTLDGQYYIHIMSQNIPSDYNPSKSLLEKPFFNELYQYPYIFWQGIEDNTSFHFSHQFIPIIRPIYEKPDHPIGFIYMEVSPEILSTPLLSYPSQKNKPLVCINNHAYFLEKDNFVNTSNPISHASESKISYLDIAVSLYTIKHGFRNEKYISVQTDIDNIIIIQKINSSGFTYGNSAYLFMLLIIFALISASGIIISFILKKRINEPIKKICSKIEQIGYGDFSKSTEINYNNELGNIGKGINVMAEKVSYLLNKRVEDEKRRQELEYEILQSQINPHFLFNTLNSIKWMATIQGAQGVADMITSLAHLMKNISKSNSSLIPLKNELELLDDYFFIQRHRYGGGIKLRYIITNENLLNCLILRFSLQPIVENALFHGIEPKNSEGTILIQVSSNGDKELIIKITDNGIGMSSELIEKSLSEADNTNHEFFKHVGIYNVNQRIICAFGSEYGITIKSKIGHYTSTIFKLPFLIN